MDEPNEYYARPSRYYRGMLGIDDFLDNLTSVNWLIYAFERPFVVAIWASYRARHFNDENYYVNAISKILNMYYDEMDDDRKKLNHVADVSVFNAICGIHDNPSISEIMTTKKVLDTCYKFASANGIKMDDCAWLAARIGYYKLVDKMLYNGMKPSEYVFRMCYHRNHSQLIYYELCRDNKRYDDDEALYIAEKARDNYLRHLIRVAHECGEPYSKEFMDEYEMYDVWEEEYNPCIKPALTK